MGENGAGKSTMMKCLFGTYQKDEGTIYLDGKEISFSGPKDALENGIAMVHQELNQCLERNVVDNLFLGRYPVNSMGVVDEGRMKKKATELFRRLGMTVNLSQPMRLSLIHISKNEYTNEPGVDLRDVVAVGSEMEAKVVKVNDGEGQVALSYKRLAADRGNKLSLIHI